MVRFSLAETRMDRIRNENIRERWFGRVQSRDCGCTIQRILNVELPGRREKGRPHRRFGDVVEDTRRMLRIGGGGEPESG